MDYLSQKIKSSPKIEVRPELHRQIMKRILYAGLRYPLWILASLTSLIIATDVWLVLDHSFVKVMESLTSGLVWGPSSVARVGTSIMDKALLHPDLLANLLLDTLLLCFTLYAFSYLKGGGKNKVNRLNILNSLAWFRQLFRLNRMVK